MLGAAIWIGRRVCDAAPPAPSWPIPRSAPPHAQRQLPHAGAALFSWTGFSAQAGGPSDCQVELVPPPTLDHLVVTLYVVTCLVLMLVVLIQQGKGGDLASAFGGGSSQAAFGARTGATLLTKVTWVCAALFVIGRTVAVHRSPARSRLGAWLRDTAEARGHAARARRSGARAGDTGRCPRRHLLRRHLPRRSRSRTTSLSRSACSGSLHHPRERDEDHGADEGHDH